MRMRERERERDCAELASLVTVCLLYLHALHNTLHTHTNTDTVALEIIYFAHVPLASILCGTELNLPFVCAHSTNATCAHVRPNSLRGQMATNSSSLSAIKLATVYSMTVYLLLKDGHFRLDRKNSPPLLEQQTSACCLGTRQTHIQRVNDNGANYLQFLLPLLLHLLQD